MITVVGSLVMDLTVQVPHLVQPGGVVHGHALQVACGGRGANQACAVARMGAQATLIGMVGADLFGDAMLAALAKDGVDTCCVWRSDGGSSGCFVVAADPRGQTEIIVANGINGSLSRGQVESHAALIAASQALITQLETSYESAETALRLAHAAGVLTILNAAPTFRFQTSVLPWCDIVCVNEPEAADIAGSPVHDVEGAARAAAAIRRLGAGSVIVTLGAQGAWVDSQQWQGHVAGYTVEVVDTLGAGDTFAGALAVRLCEGAELRAAVEFATAAAAIAVTRRGAQPSIPSRAEVEEFYQTARKPADHPEPVEGDRLVSKQQRGEGK